MEDFELTDKYVLSRHSAQFCQSLQSNPDAIPGYESYSQFRFLIFDALQSAIIDGGNDREELEVSLLRQFGQGFSIRYHVVEIEGA